MALFSSLTSPLTNEVLRNLYPILEYMRLDERQDFMIDFDARFKECPWNMAGVIEDVIDVREAPFQMSDDIQDELEGVLENARIHDEQFAAKWLSIIPSETVIAQALESIRNKSASPAESLGITKSEYTIFEDYVTKAAQIKPEGWRYNNLITMTADFLSENGQAYWTTAVNNALINLTIAPGNVFRNSNAEYIARGSNVLQSLPMDKRVAFCEALDNAADTHSSLSEIFHEACETLDSNVRAQLESSIQQESTMWETDDLDIADYDYEYDE